MKQIMILERSDLDMLKKGEPLVVTLPGGQVMEFRYASTAGQARKTVMSDGKSIKEAVRNLIVESKSPLTNRDIAKLTGLHSASITAALSALRIAHKIKHKRIKLSGTNKAYAYSANGDANGKAH